MFFIFSHFGKNNFFCDKLIILDLNCFLQSSWQIYIFLIMFRLGNIINFIIFFRFEYNVIYIQYLLLIIILLFFVLLNFEKKYSNNIQFFYLIILNLKISII